MKIIHDSDAAYEDIMALTLLLLNADVVAVTVTYGESNTNIGALNLERVCRTLKPLKNIPVAYGINDPIDHHFGNPFPEFIKKEADTILKDTDMLPFVTSEITSSAVELIYKTLMSGDEKTIIVATGPLTNIAQLLITYPDCIEKIEKLVIMGGAIKVPGNISDLIYDTTNTVAEWNIYADRKAADIVFTSKNLQIMLVPIDITRQMPMTKMFYEGLAHEQLPALKLVSDMLTSLFKGMGEKLFYDKLQFWDSLSAMITLNNSMAEFEELPITVDLITGQTKINNKKTDGVPLVCIAMKLINPVSAYDLFVTLMKTSPANSQNVKQVPISLSDTGISLERQITSYRLKCLEQIARLSCYTSQIARRKCHILEEAINQLDSKSPLTEQIKLFHNHIIIHKAELEKPHSSIPKDVLKGVIVFIGYILGIYPGIILRERFFGENRPTTTGEQIVHPVEQAMII